MTPHEAFADGNLADAVALQEAAVAARPADPAARLFLIDLLTFSGRLREAWDHLRQIESADPDWPVYARGLRDLLRAEWRRSHRGRRPFVYPRPAPKHARLRVRALLALADHRPDDAVRLTDRADAATPEVAGFIDGQPFTGLRDADDRFASVLEVFVGRVNVWVPWEAVRTVRLAPAADTLDRLFRPATVRLRAGAELPVRLPLVYPGSHEADGVFAVGLETDRVCPDDGPVRCVGGKMLIVGDEGDEVPLAECRMIEVR
jgi:type VI secretion system protein ImpE